MNNFKKYMSITWYFAENVEKMRKAETPEAMTEFLGGIYDLGYLEAMREEVEARKDERNKVIEEIKKSLGIESNECEE